MTIVYRNAVPSDVLDFIALVEEYCDENSIQHNMASIKKYIDFQLGKLPTLVAADGDKTVGVISFMAMPNPFNVNEIWGRKLACFVSKDYREQGIGKELISKAEEFCKQQGAIKFYFTGPESPGEDYKSFETEYYKDI